MKKSKITLILLLVALACIASYFGLRAYSLEKRAADSGKEIVLEIPRGHGSRAIARLLREKGVIDSEWAFILAARVFSDQKGLKAGEYALNPTMTNRRLIEIMVRGQVIMHSVSIPEGFAMTDIIDRLTAAGLVERDEAARLVEDGDFIKSLGLGTSTLEGYLFPDTYSFPKSMGAKAILRVMVKRFQKEWAKLDELARKSHLDRNQAVTLASIIEREAKLPEERRMISAVYHNRLKKGMLLQADPTVSYGMPDFNGRLTQKDLSHQSPYNTYLNRGLPPGPICSPGGASLAAALDPAKSDALYFVARGDGGHHFSKTYKEHTRAVRRWYRLKKNRR